MQGLDTLPHWHSGKACDTYEIPHQPRLLLPVRSDRLSTHNIVHLSVVPGKGELLTALSVFWHRHGIAPTHLVAAGAQLWKYLPSYKFAHELSYRGLVVQRRVPHPVEFIWRRHLTGSLEKALRLDNDPYGLNLARNLPKMHRFDKPIFTPTQKSVDDEPMLSADVLQKYPRASGLTYKAFIKMEQHLASVGITLMDAKFEADEEMLVDEFGTGDCCRMALTSKLREGEDPPWLDKEVFRVDAMRQWRGGPKVPLTFSDEVLKKGTQRYHEAFERITGQTLTDFQRNMVI